ncbi:hypothetical protein [Aeromonas sp. S41-2]|uniref:hypothetical protein n=1 Tax=Aeromonas sp. S41-2 TaxID=2990502 RepID=UPI0022DEBAC9|nr:hypothetical protein [Aeromonas sp. S41-2]
MEYVTIGSLLAALMSILATFSVQRLSNKHSALEGLLNRNHSTTLAALNHAYSKEAHAANHLYTRKASHLEKAGQIVGDLNFWAEKCVVPRTRVDFGSKQEIADRMSRAFEDLTQHTMQFPVAFKRIEGFQTHMGNLMASVNFIENMVHSQNFSAESDAWKNAVLRFMNELSPLTSALQNEIEVLMQQT